MGTILCRVAFTGAAPFGNYFCAYKYRAVYDRLYPDFIIGSSHFNMDPYEPDYREAYGEEEGLDQFFRVSLNRVRRLYDAFDSYVP